MYINLWTLLTGHKTTSKLAPNLYALGLDITVEYEHHFWKQSIIRELMLIRIMLFLVDSNFQCKTEFTILKEKWSSGFTKIEMQIAEEQFTHYFGVWKIKREFNN